MTRLSVVRLFLTTIFISMGLFVFCNYSNAEVLGIKGQVMDSDGQTPLPGTGLNDLANAAPNGLYGVVQLIAVGDNGQLDPPDCQNQDLVGGDDIILLTEEHGLRFTAIGEGFPFFPSGRFTEDFNHSLNTGDKVYCRAWNGTSPGKLTHYGDSELYTIQKTVGENHDFGLWNTDITNPCQTIPDIKITPDSVDFGDVEYDPDGNSCSEIKTMKIENIGDADLSISKADLKDNTNNEFQIIDKRPVDISNIVPQAFAEIDLQYCPLDEGPDNIELEVESNDPDNPRAGVTLSGNGIGSSCEDIPLDHFLSYKNKETKGSDRFKKETDIILEDRLEKEYVEVIKPMLLYNPASKNGEDIIDKDTHLMGYLIKEARKLCKDDEPVPPDMQGKPCRNDKECGGEKKTCERAPKFEQKTNIKVEDQFGTLSLDIIKPELLLVPSSKCIDTIDEPCPKPLPEPDPASHCVDHYKCYKVKVSKGTDKFSKGVTATVKDQFEQLKRYDLKVPKRLCLAAKKTRNDNDPKEVKNSDKHLLCYLVKQTKKVCTNLDDPQLDDYLKPCRKDEHCGMPKGSKVCVPQPKHVKKTGVIVSNQFGQEFVDTIKEDNFCVPVTVTLDTQP